MESGGPAGVRGFPPLKCLLIELRPQPREGPQTVPHRQPELSSHTYLLETEPQSKHFRGSRLAALKSWADRTHSGIDLTPSEIPQALLFTTLYSHGAVC